MMNDYEIKKLFSMTTHGNFSKNLVYDFQLSEMRGSVPSVSRSSSNTGLLLCGLLISFLLESSSYTFYMNISVFLIESFPDTEETAEFDMYIRLLAFSFSLKGDT